jgi:NAD-dependent SIR2 family protein deacetylase
MVPLETLHLLAQRLTPLSRITAMTGAGVSVWDRCQMSPPRWRDETAPYAQLPPACPHCGGLIRPGVVWFGESLDPDAVDRALAATHCDIFFTIGTSSVVYPAASLVDEARRHGAVTVGINPEATAASGAIDLVLRGPAEQVLAEIDADLQRGI